jgi:nucleoside-diphosphate-sugar epimerase
MSVAITGSAGFIGSLLSDAFKAKGYNVVGIDRAIPSSQHTNDQNAKFNIEKEKYVDIVCDLSDASSCHGIFDGCDIVIHLAGDGNPKANFISSLVPNNIVSVYNVCIEAKRANVKRIIFASSNHTQVYGFEQMNAATEGFAGKICHPEKLINMENSSSCPTSLYGVSKIAGEAIGQFYSVREKAFEFIALRIGWVVYNNANVHKGTPLNDYLQSMYLSKEDCIGFFVAAAEAILEEKNSFFVGYAVSNNETRIYDLTETCKILKYTPVDGNGCTSFPTNNKTD